MTRRIKEGAGELGNTIWFSILTVIMAVIIIVGIGLAVQSVFVEPHRQESYQFGVSSQLNDWCGASPTDPFNMQTLSALKSNRDGNPDRFKKLPYQLQESVNAAIRGDHVAACGN